MLPAIRENFELQREHQMADDVIYERILERI